MATHDFSRSAHDPRKHFVGVRLQQGRVLTDDDVNSLEDIRAESERQALQQVIGDFGSSDDGFRISNPRFTGSAIDFDIGAGTMWVGGNRAVQEAVESFVTQSDWLQQADVDRAVPAGARRDLVYLEVYEQPVSAVEDSELFEAGLGIDTSTRVQLVRRVRVRRAVGTVDCADAWDVLLDDLETGHEGSVVGAEVIPDLTLTVTYPGGGDPDDLCSPTVAAGYLGAKNSTIRVQLTSASTLTWGYDNAAPLYRVTVDSAGVVTFLTPPRDQQHMPVAGQIVEILPAGAVLPNGEVVQERGGAFFTVDSSYVPEVGEITLLEAWDPAFGQEHTTRSDASDLEFEHYYLRVWDRGSDRSSPPEIPFTVGSPVTLTHTGLAVTIDGTDVASPQAHWVVAVRPETPDQVVPWELESGRAPHGCRRWIAPLATIRWNAAEPEKSVIHDCRPYFRPLTHPTSCCVVTVGDGRSSHGDFEKIQEAVEALPPEGGKVCVLRGEYTESVVIDQGKSITIEGCGSHTHWQSAGEDPALTILGGVGIGVKQLSLEFRGGTVIRVAKGRSGKGPVGLTFEGLSVLARDFEALRIEDATDFRIANNTFEAMKLRRPIDESSAAGRAPLVSVRGRAGVIVRNRIKVLKGDTTGQTAHGGLHLWGRCTDIDVRNNRITAGTGTGILLGSLCFVPVDDLPKDPSEAVKCGESVPWLPGWILFLGQDDCAETDPWRFPWYDDDNRPLMPVSEGDLNALHIGFNLIRGMGQSGIGVAHYWDPAGPYYDTIACHGVHIRQNTIRDCAQGERVEVAESVMDLQAVGGITLGAVEDLRLRDNRILDNGANHVAPICGVFVLSGTRLIVHRNQIVDNGPRTRTQKVPEVGSRGGLVVAALYGEHELHVPERPAGEPALRVHDNVIVQQVGRCIRVGGTGDVTISDNDLATFEPDPRTGSVLVGMEDDAVAQTQVVSADVGVQAAVVEVFQLATDHPIMADLLEYASDVLGDLSGQLADSPFLVGGRILVTDNRIRYDVRGRDPRPSPSAIALFSLDDVAFCDNQVAVHSNEQAAVVNSTVALFGISTRMQGNAVFEGLLDTALSGTVFGLMASVQSNQTTHCIFTIGLYMRSKFGNQHFIDLVPAEVPICDLLDKFEERIQVEFQGAEVPVGNLQYKVNPWP